MDTPTASLRDLARRLLVFEAADPGGTGTRVHEAVRVHEKLRTSVTRFAGADGFASLLRRALVMARSEFACLGDLTFNPDGSVDGLDALAPDAAKNGSEAAVAITAHLLGLLVTFIGEPFTLRLLREAWPDASFEEAPKD